MRRLTGVLPRRGRWVVKSVKKVRFVGGRDMHISEGIRNMKEYESASFYGCYMTLCPWLSFGRKMKGYRPRRAWGKVGPHGVFRDRKRYESRQEAVTAELRSRGTMYRKELASKTGTRLS